MYIDLLMNSGANSDVLNSNGTTSKDVTFQNASMTCTHEVRGSLTKRKENVEQLKQGNSMPLSK
jgi:hypothetical protein